jgi:hypothetical protein
MSQQIIVIDPVSLAGVEEHSVTVKDDKFQHGLAGGWDEVKAGPGLALVFRSSQSAIINCIPPQVNLSNTPSAGYTALLLRKKYYRSFLKVLP